MTEQQESQTTEQRTSSSGEAKSDAASQLDRIWHEIKDIARQLENETRRGGRIARLRFERRGLRRDFDAVAARVGSLVYEAQMQGGKRPTLSRVQGYDAAIEKMADLRAQIAAKEDEIAELQHQGSTTD